MLLGARVRLPESHNEGADFAWGQQAYGPLQVTRDYLSGPVPSRYVDRFPPSTQVILSLKSVDGPLSDFLWSLDTRSVSRLVFQHEPERPNLFSSGDDFVRQFDAARAKIKAIRPEIQVGIASSGFNYRGSRPGADGSYLSKQADFYTIDTYRAGTDENASSNGVVPIDQRPEIMRWYALVKDRGKPLGITEVGMGRVGGGADPATPADRVEVVAHDVAWARAHGFFCYSYFLSGQGPDGHNWLDNSAAFQAMYRALPRG